MRRRKRRDQKNNQINRGNLQMKPVDLICCKKSSFASILCPGDKKDASLMESISDGREMSFQDSSDLLVEASDSNPVVKPLEDRMLTCDYTDDFKPPIRKEDERKKRKK